MKEAVTGIVIYNGMVLIGKKDPNREGFLKGKWHIPGETLEKNENDYEALIRGFKAETGLDIIVRSYLASHETPTRTKVRWYECFTYDNNPVAGEDLVEVKFVPKKDVLKYCDREATSLWPGEVIEYFNR